MTQSPPIVIAADAGHRAGFGHLGRCLAIWEELSAHTAFSVEDETAAAFLESRGVRVVGGIAAPRVLVLDRASPTPRELVEQTQSSGCKVCLVDDPGPGRELADLVVDPPTASRWPPAGGRRLAGFEHVLVRSEIRNAVPLDEARSRVLIGIGGSDPAGLTPILAAALDAAGIATIAAMGPGYRGDRPAGRVLRSPDSWGPALAASRAAVVGFGHSLLEAAHLGVPVVAAVFKAEHLDDARHLVREGAMDYVDMTAGPKPDELLRRVLRLMATPAGEQMGRRGRELVDGRGGVRVARAIADLAR